MRLSVSSELESVVLLPGRVLGTVVVSVSLSDSSGLLSGGSEASGLPSLVDGVADPVDSGVPADGLVGGVDEDDLEVLVDTVLVDPVGVKHSETSTPSGNSLLSNGPQGPLELELVDSVVGGLSVGGSLGDLLLPSSSADTDSVDYVSLLCLVAQSTGLVWAGRLGGSVDDVELSVLPASHSLQEPSEITLLLG